ADALGSKVSVMSTAGEGGAWGMALLAAFGSSEGKKTLPDWLDSTVFAGMDKSEVLPDEKGKAGWAAYMEQYRKGLSVVKVLGEI
ncbi:MAG: ATPase, partial [Ruminococcus sp.]|nr:ATPase [Ruminococcus sp.]